MKIITVDKKVDIVCATLANSIYRPWYWSNYKAPANQHKFRSDWRKVLAKVDPTEIRTGLNDWESAHGIQTPPTPSAFINFIKPKHTAASRLGIQTARQSIGMQE